MDDKNRKLMIDGNAFYEIDLECMCRKKHGESCQNQKQKGAGKKQKPRFSQ